LNHGALHLLEEYHWPGNIRELRNMLERIVAMAQREIVSAAFVKKLLEVDSITNVTGECVSEEVKRIEDTLNSCEGRIGDTAKALKISRSTLWRKMNNLGLKTK
jgi:transcriptional regulator of acetoin/glycerol metabolism